MAGRVVGEGHSEMSTRGSAVFSSTAACGGQGVWEGERHFPTPRTVRAPDPIQAHACHKPCVQDCQDWMERALHPVRGRKQTPSNPRWTQKAQCSSLTTDPPFPVPSAPTRAVGGGDGVGVEGVAVDEVLWHTHARGLLPRLAHLLYLGLQQEARGVGGRMAGEVGRQQEEAKAPSLPGGAAGLVAAVGGAYNARCPVQPGTLQAAHIAGTTRPKMQSSLVRPPTWTLPTHQTTSRPTHTATVCAGARSGQEVAAVNMGSVLF